MVCLPVDRRGLRLWEGLAARECAKCEAVHFNGAQGDRGYSPTMPAALMIGHHLTISAF
jgi:hypothetical protein